MNNLNIHKDIIIIFAHTDLLFMNNETKSFINDNYHNTKFYTLDGTSFDVYRIWSISS